MTIHEYIFVIANKILVWQGWGGLLVFVTFILVVITGYYARQVKRQTDFMYRNSKIDLINKKNDLIIKPLIEMDTIIRHYPKDWFNFLNVPPEKGSNSIRHFQNSVQIIKQYKRLDADLYPSINNYINCLEKMRQYIDTLDNPNLNEVGKTTLAEVLHKAKDDLFKKANIRADEISEELEGLT